MITKYSRASMKTNGFRRALMLTNIFNLLVALYFVVISIVSLVHLRWYHQLTITIKIRHLVTSATSYFAFLILIFTALVLIVIFIMNTISLSSRTYISPSGQDATSEDWTTTGAASRGQQNVPFSRRGPLTSDTRGRLVLQDSTTLNSSSSSVCCSILLHLITSISLIVILIIWLLNTGELVRDSISTQLDEAFVKYQFANRSNHYSVAIDGMQDVNNCCGSLDYTDFPHQRTSGLSSGHYPGSCCGKNIFGVNARVICTPEEIVRARQTAGCTNVLANYYDLISLLVVPVSLACLFVNITLIAMITISKGHSIRQNSIERPPYTSGSVAKFELKPAS